MSKIVFYHSPYSPFSRSVLLLCRYLKLDIEVKILDLMSDEQSSPEFLKINPQHCVPTIDDNGFFLWESRAILSYLLDSRAAHLVPASPKEKAIVNQRLYYEMGVLGKKYADLFRPLFEGETEIKSETVAEMYDVLSVIEDNYFANGNEWIAGETITIADFAYISTIAGLVEAGISLDKHPRLKAWFNRCKTTLPEYKEAVEAGAKLFGDWLKENATKGIY